MHRGGGAAGEKKRPFCFISLVHSLGLCPAAGIRQVRASSVYKSLNVSPFLKILSWRLKDPKEGTHGKGLPTRLLAVQGFFSA